jgi:hypothetical protein
LERVHFWKAYWARVSDTHFDTPQRNYRVFKVQGRCVEKIQLTQFYSIT